MSTASPKTNVPPLGSVLVTGGCGFLGSHIVSYLLQNTSPSSTRVSVLDLRTSGNTHAGAAYHSADLTQPTSVRSVLAAIKPDIIIHTASPVFVTVGNEKKARELMWSVNVEGTRCLLEEAKKLGGVKGLVYTSSASVVSDSVRDLINADERWGIVRGKGQGEYYTETKAAAESLVLSANTRASPTPFLTTALRPALMFGERDVQFIPPVIKTYATGRTGWQIGPNDNLWDFTYVGNAAYAHVLAAQRLLETHASLPSKPITASETALEKDGVDADDDDEEDRVDGEPFIITNATPLYFWDFTRAVWNSYHDALAAQSPASSTGLLKTPPPSRPRELDPIVALLLASLASLAFWVLRLGSPTLTPQKVRFSVMTRYFRPAKAQAVLGYAPVVGLEEAIERTGRWFAERSLEEAAKKDE